MMPKDTPPGIRYPWDTVPEHGDVIEVAEGIPFIELTDWQHDKLYALKGEIVRRGLEQVTGLTMPTFEKCRFQHGASTEEVFANLFPADEQSYRNAFRQVLE